MLLAWRHLAKSLGVNGKLLPDRVLLVLFAFIAPFVHAADLEFEGTPSVRIYVSDGVAHTESVSPERALEFAVKIVRTDSGYLWASRDNIPMVKQEAGAYITYSATNCAGYVRVVSPAGRRALQSLEPEQQKNEFVYLEHLVNLLGSITYFGK